MIVQELYDKLNEYIDQGRGNYEVVTEGGCVGLDIDCIDVWDNTRQINLS